MKKSIFTFAIIAVALTTTLLVGCDSAAQKSDKADTKLQDATQSMNEAQKAADEAAAKATYAEAWKTYKLESETKINDNDISIAALKASIKKAGKKADAAQAKMVDELEEKNAKLKARLNEYNAGQTEWESFKREFNHDMDGIGQSLRDLTVNNKK